MENDLMATSEPVVISSEIAEELDLEVADETETISEVEIVPDDILTNETYINGVNELVNTIDPLSVNEEVYYIDRGTVYALAADLPDYAVVYACNNVEVVFPMEYAEAIVLSDGMLINLGNSYTAGLQLDGYSVSNYLSSEITIPTYHSATWYQYLQAYGQPYRIVDRYVNTYGNISSSTRETVSVEWSGGNPWEGFTFERIALFVILALIAVMFIFRKGRL